MAPKHWNKSHLLTILLRHRIATWSFIFLKTAEIHQKSAVQRNTTISSRNLFLPPLAPSSQSAAWFYCPFISPVQAGSQDAVTATSEESDAWAPAPHRPGHPRPRLQGRRHSERGLRSSNGLEVWEGPWETAARLLHGQKREGEKIRNCCCGAKGGSQSRFNSRALEFNGKIPLASEKKSD